jgi:predicted phage tail protein
MIRRRIPDPRGLPTIARKGAGKGGAPAAQTPPHQPTTSPNTLVSLSTARIAEVLSEGIVAGMHTTATNGQFWNSVYFDDTAVCDPAGNFNFTLFDGQFSYGYPFQDPLVGFPISESETVVGIKTLYAIPIVRTLSDPRITTVRYTLEIPALYTQEGDGDVIPASVAYAFDVQIDGGVWTNAVTERIEGKTMSPYFVTVGVSTGGTATTSINIRLIRLDFNDMLTITNDLVWSTYTEVVDGLINYEDTCVIAVTVNAQEFPNLPQRSYLLDGILLQVPTSYDSRGHTDPGTWDGTFNVAWTNNPAWVLYNLIVNDRWGVGRDIDATAVDKWSFYEAQLYNDQYIPDGLGGYEPRWTCNCVINTRQDAWQVLSAVASSMLATLYFANGTIFLVQDRLIANPTRIFGPAEVEQGMFTYTGTDIRARWTAVPVGWVDPDDKYQAAVELVVDPALVAQQGYREAPQQQAFGCTSRSQAIRVGRWFIYTSQFETEVVSFTVGLENADLRPGDYIAINDPGRAGARLAGRLLDDHGANTVTLDQAPADLYAHPEYGWYLYVTVGSAAEGAKPIVYSVGVSSWVGTTGQLVVSGKPSPTAFPVGSAWMLNSPAVEPTPWRVNSIMDAGGSKYQVMATEYHNEKFDYVDYGWLRPEPPFSLLPTGPLLGPTNVTDTEYIYRDSAGLVQFGVVLSWTASSDPRVSNYQIEMSGPRGEYLRFSSLVGVTQDVPAMSQGPWKVQIRAFDNIGRRSAIIEYDFTPIGLSALPLAPTALYITPQGGNLSTLIWTVTGEIDVAYYWVKWTPKLTDATWERATTSIARVDYNTTQINTPTLAGTFMVKTIDSLGQESAEWAEAILQPQQTETSIFFDEHQEPAWAGDLGPYWHHNLDELVLPPPSAPEPLPPGIFASDRATVLNQSPTRVGIYSFDAGFDLGASTLVTMTGYLEGYGSFSHGDFMATWVPLAAQAPLAQGDHVSISDWIPLAMAQPMALGSSTAWDGRIEAQVSMDGTTYGDWFPLKSTVITGQAFRWRMVGAVYDLQTSMRVVQAGVIIEVPLRNVQGSDVAMDGTGHLTVTYVAPFLVTPTVQLTARQSLAPGGNVVITESDRNHFKVENRDASGAPHAGGSIDYFVQGFGGHS